MLRIRLRRTGKKHQPHYRIVVAEHTAPITGKYVSAVGHYNPRSKELVVDDAAVTQWLNQGAQPSNTIAKLLTKHGLKHKLIQVHMYPVRPGKSEQPADEAPAAAPAVEAADTASDAAPAADTGAEAEQAPATETEPAAAEAATETPAEESKE